MYAEDPKWSRHFPELLLKWSQHKIAYFSAENADSENGDTSFSRFSFLNRISFEFTCKIPALKDAKSSLQLKNMIMTESSFDFRINENNKSNKWWEFSV